MLVKHLKESMLDCPSTISGLCGRLEALSYPHRVFKMLVTTGSGPPSVALIIGSKLSNAHCNIVISVPVPSGDLSLKILYRFTHSDGFKQWRTAAMFSFVIFGLASMLGSFT